MQRREIIAAGATSRLNFLQRLLRCTAVAVFVVYLWWQISWISLGRIPDSILLALTGIPAPTTGGTRSWLALMDGNLALSVHHNPMTIPIVGLTVVSLIWPIVRGIKGQRVFLPRPIVMGWAAVLLFAWIIKILQTTLAPSVG